jgi:hypothetical protein
MIDLRRMGAVATVAMLAGCGGTQPPMGAPNALDPHGKKHSQTFSYTGSEQTFKVPTGVTRVTITASGASGGRTSFGSGQGGLGGMLIATVGVTPGESLAVFVGGQGTNDYSRYGYGGFNGGGSGGEYSGGRTAGGGGGASDVRQGGDGLQNRILVAGGGGGQGCCGGGGGAGTGGAGGGRKSDAGSPPQREGPSGGGGGGTTQRHGGNGGRGGHAKNQYCGGGNGTDGAVGEGGQGGFGCNFAAGAGGGGGYYGGGGAGGAAFCRMYECSLYGGYGGGGGGGSSYAEARATHVTDKRGAAAPGDGEIVISWHSD